MAAKYENLFEKDYQKLLENYDIKSEEYKQLKYEYQLLQRQLETHNKQLKIAIFLILPFIIVGVVFTKTTYKFNFIF